MAASCNLVLSGASIPGLVRGRNEDNFCLFSSPGRPLAFAAVADGIGGHRDGDLASLVCCRELLSAFVTAGLSPDRPEDAESFLTTQVAAVNERIFRRNRMNPCEHPMGTTLVCAVFAPDFLTLANVGDSRLYQYGGGELRQLSTDHSLCGDPQMMQKFRELGLQCDPASVICRSVGTNETVEPQLATLPRSGNERYLLCSDGAYRDTAQDKFSSLLGNSATPKEAVNELLRSALMAGGKDNITAVAAFPLAAEEAK